MPNQKRNYFTGSLLFFAGRMVKGSIVFKAAFIAGFRYGVSLVPVLAGKEKPFFRNVLSDRAAGF